MGVVRGAELSRLGSAGMARGWEDLYGLVDLGLCRECIIISLPTGGIMGLGALRAPLGLVDDPWNLLHGVQLTNKRDRHVVLLWIELQPAETECRGNDGSVKEAFVHQRNLCGWWDKVPNC